MGWWSNTVLGGDGPCDVADTIEGDILGMDFEVEYTPDEIKELLTSKLPQLASDEWVAKLSQYEDVEIVYQVMGYYVLTYGADPTNEHVRIILERAKQGAISDDWAQRDEGRKGRMDELVRAIEGFDGTPVELAREGLFEVIFNHVESGKPGLVNVNT